MIKKISTLTTLFASTNAININTEQANRYLDVNRDGRITFDDLQLKLGDDLYFDPWTKGIYTLGDARS